MLTIYLPVEIISRELMARAFLATSLANNEHKIYVFEHTFFDRNGWIDSGVYIGKNCFRTEVPYEKSFYNNMKRSGIDLWYLDEEGGIYVGDKHSWKERLAYRLNPNDLDKNDKILTWGNWQKGVFESKSPAALTLVSGIPNFDIMQTKYQNSLLEWDLKVTGGRRDFILINTRFSLGNSKNGISQMFDLDQPYSKNLPELYLEYVCISDNKMMFDIIELCIFLARSLPDEKIIIRPHPGENKEIYQTLTKKLKNITVIFEGGVESWIRMSKVLIHNGCTTAIQAIIAKKNVITYMPCTLSQVEMDHTPELPNTIGRIAHTYEDVLLGINKDDVDDRGTWKDTISRIDSIEFISKLANNHMIQQSKDGGRAVYSSTRLFIYEKMKDIIGMVANYINTDREKKSFDYKEFSKIVDLVDVANNVYKSNVKCKKISNGCYCIHK
jgi:surface carbohydrate biosynthesis protein